MFRTLSAAALALVLVACGASSPGPLAGTWRAGGVMPLQTTFRNGEMESMGVIEKVSYKVDGNSVIVTMADGPLKGTSVRYVVVNPTTIQAMGMTYRKVSN